MKFLLLQLIIQEITSFDVILRVSKLNFLYITVDSYKSLITRIKNWVISLGSCESPDCILKKSDLKDIHYDIFNKNDFKFFLHLQFI
jgi:hypothetical protein